MTDQQKILSSFNPRSRAGSDLAGFQLQTMDAMFQSTLPRGERRRTLDTVVKSVKFQSTLPRGERPGCFSGVGYATCSFNPRSRAGSDVVNEDETAAGNVSIHAPARGATACRVPQGSDCRVSIHAPARGAT